MRAKLMASFALVASMIVVGCGGGGSSPASAPAVGKLGVFVTDAVGPYDHVWVTIKKVELVGSAGTSTVFSDPKGKVMDLVSLNQAGQQKFALMGVKAPSGKLSQVKFHLDPNLTVFPKGSATGSAKRFDDAPGTEKVLSLSVSDSSKDVVADFDISKWKDNGSTISAVVVQGNSSQVAGNTQGSEDFKGTLGALTGTAPNFAFDLTGPAGTIHVVTTDQTAIVNANGSANPTLQNGERIEVIGTVDSTTKTISAASVKIETTETESEAEVNGTILSIGTDTFALTVTQAKGFQPSNTSVTVNVGANTVYSNGDGVTLSHDDFFAALQAGASAEAEGTIDAASNTLTATKVSIENETENEQGHEVKVIGTVSTIDATAGTLSLTVQKWEGTVLTAGATVNVTVSAQTQLKGVSLSTIKVGDSLEVRGPIDNGTMTAQRLRAGSSDGGNGGGDGGGGNGGDDGGGHGGGHG